MNNGLISIPNIINGIQRILGVASQIVPLYKKVKPVINNAKSIINVIPAKYNKKEVQNEVNNLKKEKKPFNSPQFFL